MVLDLIASSGQDKLLQKKKNWNTGDLEGIERVSTSKDGWL